ncbi:MAG: radical SAM protein [Alphaproteobacteria bacterium]|nr:radical SAM protein [Alphaproteobacteria bacterium]
MRGKEVDDKAAPHRTVDPVPAAVAQSGAGRGAGKPQAALTVQRSEQTGQPDSVQARKTKRVRGKEADDRAAPPGTVDADPVSAAVAQSGASCGGGEPPAALTVQLSERTRQEGSARRRKTKRVQCEEADDKAALPGAVDPDPVSAAVAQSGPGCGGGAPQAALTVQLLEESSFPVIGLHRPPDQGCRRAINPYRGCEHGCVYCFARATCFHRGPSLHTDFQSRLFVRRDAPASLGKELAASGYRPQLIALGTLSDPYQPVERECGITRAILEVLDRANHPVVVFTKSDLVLRDAELLAAMARRELVRVVMSLTTLDTALARALEPGVPTPERRLEAMRELVAAGIPTRVMIAPVIPGLTDGTIEPIVDAAALAGVREAGHELLRLPLELRDFFREWLVAHYPNQYRQVFARIRDIRNGRDHDDGWETPTRSFAPLVLAIAQRFDAACARAALNKGQPRLTTCHFVKSSCEAQLSLF